MSMTQSERINPVSATSLVKLVNRSSNNTVIDWSGHKIVVRKLLTLKEVHEFVESVLRVCFPQDGKLFTPEVMDLAIRANTVMRYATIELPPDLDDQIRVLYGTNLYDVILANINYKQHQSLIEAIRLYMK